MWGGRFRGGTDKLVQAFSASIQYDSRLYRQDVRGSIAHARMLGKQGILAAKDVKSIVKGLKEIEGEIERGELPFRIELEDIHMHIERRLTEKIGPAGGRLHTARSRNDQVNVDVRMYLREEARHIRLGIAELAGAFLYQAEKHAATPFPGYTHLQRAQPVTFGHHMLAYVEMLRRDAGRFADAVKRMNDIPLGVAALAGTPYGIDRKQTAKELGFDGVTRNSIDTSASRDFAVEFLADCAIAAMHLSRLSEELILWSTAEFKFIELADAYCTGSSIMPQKKNPDVPELVRGKTGRVYGALITLLTICKGLPLAYNRDLQEDKEPLFDAIDTLRMSLAVTAGAVRTMTLLTKNVERSLYSGHLTATDLADFLAMNGIPFREAHEITGKIVRDCEDRGVDTSRLVARDLVKFHPVFAAAPAGQFTIGASIAARKSQGGTAPARVRAALEEARRWHAGLVAETGHAR
jgi:argininosuccinate lyase